MICATFDDRANIRRGDIIKILRGIETDENLQITEYQNITSGTNDESRINRMHAMVHPPITFEIPIHGRVESVEFGDEITRLQIREGVNLPDQIFIEAGNSFRGRNVLTDIFSSEIESFAKICDRYVSVRTLNLLSNLPRNTDVQILCSDPQNSQNFNVTISSLNSNGINVHIGTVSRSYIHDRYILTQDHHGWWVGHSLKDFGQSDCHIARISDTSQVEATFNARWQTATIII